ncbi:MAG: lipid-A-disaccharide synthase [Opitutaceae bacterium]
MSFPLPPPLGGRPDVLVLAGEHSGDEHAGRMVARLLRAEPGRRVAALGGERLRTAGAQLLHDLTASSVVGLVEVLRNYGYFRRLFAALVAWIREHQPKVVCLVDYPGLNLRLAAALREQGISRAGGGDVRIVYYISPQIWAWKARRRFTMARDLDALAVIFPFEPGCYADTSLPVEFVGHPFLDPEHGAPVAVAPAGPVLLLPGSRRQAVARIYPRLVAGFRASGRAEAIALHPGGSVSRLLTAAEPHAGIAVREVPRGAAPPVGASAVLMSSGTMSLQCALAGIPGAIAYRAHPVTYVLGRMLVRVPYLGIANLLLGEEMYPEFIQGRATARALAAELRRCADDPRRREATAAHARRLRAILAAPAGGDAAGWLARQLAAAEGR